MLEKSLGRLEALVGELVVANQALLHSNAQLRAELAEVKGENDTLQLSALEQDDLQTATLARIQALIELAAAGGGNLAESPARP